MNPAIEYPPAELEDTRPVQAVAVLPSGADRDQQQVAPGFMGDRTRPQANLTHVGSPWVPADLPPEGLVRIAGRKVRRRHHAVDEESGRAAPGLTTSPLAGQERSPRRSARLHSA